MTEKLLTNKKNGMAMLLLFLAVIAAAAVAIIVGANLHLLGLMVAGVIVISLIWIPMIGPAHPEAAGSAGAYPVRAVLRHPEG